MKLSHAPITKASEIQQGMLFSKPWIDDIWMVLRIVADGEIMFDGKEIIKVDNKWSNKFWSVPLNNPGIVPTMLCFDLIFNPDTHKFYRVEP